MPRNSTGNYSLPNAPFIFGTIIDQDVVNDNFNDLAQALTGSLARNGEGGMLAPWRGQDGNVAAPAYSFTSENGLGFYRAGTDDLRASSVGTDIMKWSATEVRTYRAAFFENGLTVDAAGVDVALFSATQVRAYLPGFFETGLTVVAGGFTVTAGGVTVVAGGSSITGTAGVNGGVVAAHALEATGMSTTNGHTQPLTSVAKSQLGGNSARLNVRTQNTGTVTGWEQVRLGLSYDVDTTVGAGGSFYLDKTGAVLTGGTTATATDPTNALELTNGHLKLSAAAPNADESLPATVTPLNLLAAEGTVVTDGAGGISIMPGARNISGVSIVSNSIGVSFPTPFADTNYTPTVNVNTIAFVQPLPGTTSNLTISLFTSAGAPINPATTAIRYFIHVSGQQ